MHEVVRRFDVGSLILEALRDKSLIPLMAASNEAQRDRIGNGVEWNPNAHVVHAIYSVIRIVVMPRGDFFGFGFLDQHVLVKQTRRCGAHQAERGCRNRPLLTNIGELWDAVPVHVVIEKAARGAYRGVFICPRTRVCHIGCHTLAQGF